MDAKTESLAKSVAEGFLKVAESMTTDQLDDWYEEHVGYRVSADDPTLVGKPEHATMVAEMMVLNACGEGAEYDAILGLIGAKGLSHGS